jgi:hypothetical protein
MEDMWNIKRVLVSQGNTHNKVEIQSNSELRSLSMSSTPIPRSPCLQIDTQNTSKHQFHRSHGQLKLESAAIVKSMLISRTFLVLSHLFWDDGPCIKLESTRDVS